MTIKSTLILFCIFSLLSVQAQKANLNSDLLKYCSSLSSEFNQITSDRKEYLNELNYTDNKIKGFNTNTNIENILSDSDIVVLQKNYDYLFWSILATGTVVVAMNIVKK